jgi:hypothetical protein
MKDWLRRVVPDLFLAAVVALLVTFAVQHLDKTEVERIREDAQVASEEGLTRDERIDVVGGSIRRSTLFHLPILIAVAGAVVGLGCRNRSWASLTAVGAALPALSMGVAFFIDRPIPASVLATLYASLAIAMASIGGVVRRKIFPATVCAKN